MKYFFFPSNIGLRGYHKKRLASVFVDENGKKKVESQAVKTPVIIDYPFIRGITFYILGIISLLSHFIDSVKCQLEDFNISKKVVGKFKITKSAFIYSVVCVISIVIAVFLLGFIPSKMSYLLIGMNKNFLLRNFVIAITKVALILLVFLVLRFIPAFQEIYKFNGAGNLASKSKEEIKIQGKFAHHEPLNFLNFFVFTFLLSTFVITLTGVRVSFWANWLINLAIFIGTLAFSYEILWILSRYKGLKNIAIATSFFVCMKPNITHDEVARVCFTQLNMKDTYIGEKVETGKISLSAVLAEMQTKLEKANKYEKSDVEWIIATVLGKNRAEAKLHRFFDEKTYREIMKATNERAQGKPLSAIFGFVDFYGLRFNVNKKVLAPRMETEILVDEVLKSVEALKKCEVLDIGTGSGAIAISVAKNSEAKVTALDVSKQALEVAKENARKNDAKVDFLHSDLFSGLKRRKKFDIIVSNPPYIRSLDIEGLDEEVKNYDPRLALDGGDDGLDFYRGIISEAPIHLKKGGEIFFEIGIGQYRDVKKLLEKQGFSDIKVIKDFNKINRVVKAKYGNGK